MRTLLTHFFLALVAVEATAQDLQFEATTPNIPADFVPFDHNDVELTPNAHYGNNSIDANLILRGWEGCDQELEPDPCDPEPRRSNKKMLIKAGFEEMQKMIPNVLDTNPDPSIGPTHPSPIDWNSAPAVEFFGSFQKTGAYRNLVQRTLASKRVVKELVLIVDSENINTLVYDPWRWCSLYETDNAVSGISGH
jgi:hypothetical protein